jgi:transposase
MIVAPVDRGVETVRYAYRLRPGRQAQAALEAEWHRCRWLWNEAVHQENSGIKPTLCRLSKMLTAARVRCGWLRAGSQVCQQQTLRTYARALEHSFTIATRAKPVIKTRKNSRPSLEYTANGFSIKDRRLVLAKGISTPVVWSRELPSQPKTVTVHRDTLGHWYASFVVTRQSRALAIGTAKRELLDRAKRAGRKVVMVRPAHTTTTCSQCFARNKRLKLQVRTFRCAICGYTADRDRNAARTILAVAERGHTCVDDLCSSLLEQRSEPEIPRL